MQEFAPIALFVYNRPKHTARTIAFLKKNTLAPESRLFVFSDGSKSAEDLTSVQQVREQLKGIDGFKSVEIIESKVNMGLAQAIISGVNKLIADYGQIIVFEDDLISSPYTLEYFNEALKKYKFAEKVMHIGAYMYPLQNSEQLPESFFYRASSSWGWATWERAWRHFEPDIHVLENQFDNEKVAAFTIDHTMNFWKQIQEFKKGRNNSWAIRWYATIFLREGLTLNPAHSLINNIGHDGSGIHSGTNDIYSVKINPNRILNFPEVINENPKAYEAIRHFLKHRKGSFWQRLKRYFREHVIQ